MIKRFDFLCNTCDHLDEYWVKGDVPTITCNSCGGEARRIISAVSFKCKGVGWPTSDDKWARDHEKAAGKKSS